MRAVETQWWTLALPEEWEAEQDEDAVVIADRDDVGEIVITTLQKAEGEVDERELAAMTEALAGEHGQGQAVDVGPARGYRFQFTEDGEALREWYLYCGDLLILVTYSCDLDNAGLDDSAVDEILATLAIRPSGNTDTDR